MTTINDGGPAFPFASDTIGHCSGMSLRDWLAGQALIFAGVVASGGVHKPYGSIESLHKEMAEDCYSIADAMLAAREAKK